MLCYADRWCCRYISDRFLPDKAIDLVDEAAASLRLEITSKPQALDELDRRILQLDMERVSISKSSGAHATCTCILQQHQTLLGRPKYCTGP